MNKSLQNYKDRINDCINCDNNKTFLNKTFLNIKIYNPDLALSLWVKAPRKSGFLKSILSLFSKFHS
jgi:hypothetical protein